MMSGGGSSMRKRRRSRGEGVVKLNLASMIDMFTLMVVFLLKNYSAQGQLVTPAEGLQLPSSSIERNAGEALSVKISEKNIMVENDIVVNEAEFKKLMAQKEFMIEPLYTVLSGHATSARQSAERFNTEFSGRISIQGDVAIPYNVLTRVMYTCGQAGYPVMNLVVYRKA
ncbi:MAG: biopolymer transporter ExbD [Chitinispirillaceae bacterium]|jgi:biopolymer transport protein ExbD|nr:biopolymer transporter ExbD [Chitinispirillaceae bacterium]